MRPVSVDAVGAVASVPVPLDRYIADFKVSLDLEIVSGAINATVQYTFDDVFASGYNPATGSWFDHTDITAAIAKANGTLVSPCTAVRVVNADTGTARLRVFQAGIA